MNSTDSGKNLLIDPSKRKISYLRVSLTTRCNFRCLYCYGLPDFVPGPDPKLKDEQLLMVLKTFAKLGVEKIRFTGGEPLVRPGIVDLVRLTSAIDGISRVALTTNGLRLSSLLPGLIEAGLNGLNVSLDSLQREKFKQITGYDGFDRVSGGINDAIASGVFPLVKINMVVIRGINDNEISDFAHWAIDRPVDIRFIEFMPTDKSGWGKDRLVPEKEIKERIGLPITQLSATDLNAGPARSYTVDGGRGRISFISAVSHSFCQNCNRLRLTADGKVVGCLFGKRQYGLKEILDDNPTEAELMAVLKEMITSPGFRRKVTNQSITSEKPSMRRIGG